jgi:hypothetical protein
MRDFHPYDIDGVYVEPGVRHAIDDDTGDLLLVTYTEKGWMASRHISDPADGEDDEMYWTMAGSTKEGAVVALLRCGPAYMLDTDAPYLDLSDLVEEALEPIAVQQRLPIHTSLRIAQQPVEAEYRPSTRDRSHHRTDGRWEDVNGASGSSMRPTGATFVVHRRMSDGYITHVKVVVNPVYDRDALEKCLMSIDE